MTPGRSQLGTEYPLIDRETGGLPLFMPHIPQNAASAVQEILSSRWIGQGPVVEQFEQTFSKQLCASQPAVAVGSGTDALHLAYILAGIAENHEVIAPVFSCVATNIPLLYQRASIRFADVQPDSLNIDPEHVRQLINDRTKAICCVDYGGLPCDFSALVPIAQEYGIPIIQDAAQALAATYRSQPISSYSDFTVFSFQAIKHITTGDGGMLVLRDSSLVERVRKLRWFGINRDAKQLGNWDNQIEEIGYKYQMTDIAAALGLAGLEELHSILAYRNKLFARYQQQLLDTSGVTVLGLKAAECGYAPWLLTILVEKRDELQAKLREHRIESSPVHYRNDKYDVFKQFLAECPNMDALESQYLCLPLHTRMDVGDVDRVCSVLESGW